ncbi:retinol dehydrogenase 13 [Plutella xylostella]|uniref:retinol dehydrogenase 13 n=1 Tax=Plutella xylostella TaxID=51655 RepID=UPI0020329CE1|nr:retinol dehydrogenase 13 [Plutella xylostella]
MRRDELWKCDTDVRIEGKVAVVTGATAGTGLEVAKNLARRGARVVLASRSPGKLAAARDSIVQATGNTNIVTRQMDFESLASIRNFAQQTIATEPRVDMLINNIGAVGLEDKLTADNLQLTMQVNYFGSFLLTFLLFPLLKSSAPSRIINVSSLAALLGVVDLDHFNDVGRYSSFGYYCNAKLADILFTVEMDRRMRAAGVSGVSVYSMDPSLNKSNFFRNYGGHIETFFNAALRRFGRRTDVVAKLPVYLAVDPRFEGQSGKHYRDCDEFYSSWYASDSELTAGLWEETKRLVNISSSEDWEI